MRRIVGYLLATGLAVSLSCDKNPASSGPLVPALLVIVAGNDQVDTIGAPLHDPLGVRVITRDSTGVPNVTVRFQSTADGTVSPGLSTTDATGVAFARWTLRTATGPDSVIATVSVLQGQRAVFLATTQVGRLATLALTPDTVRFSKLQDSTKIQPRGKDRAQNVVPLRPLVWSVEKPAVVSLNQSGLARALSRGVTSLSALDTVTGVRGTGFVIVDQLPSAVIVTPSADTLTWLGDTLRLSASATDSAGFGIAGAQFLWRSVNPAVARVDTVGKVTAVAVGATGIVLTYLTLEDTALVTVRQVAARLAVTPRADTLSAFSDTLQLLATVRDSGGSAIPGAPIQWHSSNATVVDVSASGAVVSHGNGIASVDARSGAVADTATVTVRQKVASVRVQPDSTALPVGGSQQFAVAALDRKGFAIDTLVVPLHGSWRSLNTNWATVNASGLASARAAGRAGAVFRQDTLADTAIVTVQPFRLNCSAARSTRASRCSSASALMARIRCWRSGYRSRKGGSRGRIDSNARRRA